MTRLTERNVSAFKATGARYDKNDRDMPGLRVRVAASGRKTWQLRYRLPGQTRQQQLNLGSWPDVSVADARQAAGAARARIAAGDRTWARQMDDNLLPKGYRTYDYVDPFENLVGPIGYKVDGDQIRCCFRVGQKHVNTQSTLHGGMLMTFADYALCLAAIWDKPGEKCVTVSLNCEFVSPGQVDDVVESTAEVVRRAGSLTFVRGQIFVGSRTLVNYSGIVKRFSVVSPRTGHERDE